MRPLPIYLSIHHFPIYLPILSLLSYLTAPKPLWDRFTSLNCDDLSQNAMGILKTTPECFVIMDRIFSHIESLNPCKTRKVITWNDVDDVDDYVKDGDYATDVHDEFDDDGDVNDVDDEVDINDDKWHYDMPYSWYRCFGISYLYWLWWWPWRRTS